MKNYKKFQKWAAARLAFFQSDEYAQELSYQFGEYPDSDLLEKAKQALFLNDAPVSLAPQIVSDYKAALADGFPDGGDWKIRIHRGNFYVGDECLESALSDSIGESLPDGLGIDTAEDRATCEAMFPGELYFLGDGDQVEFCFSPIGVCVDIPEKYFQQ